MGLKLLGRQETAKRLGISASKLSALFADGEFPKPMFPLGNKGFWFEHEIDNWIVLATKKDGNLNRKTITEVITKQRENLTPETQAG